MTNAQAEYLPGFHLGQDSNIHSRSSSSKCFALHIPSFWYLSKVCGCNIRLSIFYEGDSLIVPRWESWKSYRIISVWTFVDWCSLQKRNLRLSIRKIGGLGWIGLASWYVNVACNLAFPDSFQLLRLVRVAAIVWRLLECQWILTDYCQANQLLKE